MSAIVNHDDPDGPVVAVASPRPDFDGAVQEFLLGLLTAALLPEDDDAWLALWHEPPAVAVLESALDALPPAFDLGGEGPRVFQDLSSEDLAESEVTAIERLLIDSPGEQGISFNTDLFVKRGRVERLGRPAAAMALITMQTYAPAGGQGIRTSLRGGGPLTTLIDPRADAQGRSLAHEQPLWSKLWANVETRGQLVDRSPARLGAKPQTIFPWLAATRTSDPKAHGRETTPADAHPLQAYFGLPRRIRLEFGGAGRCDLTGQDDDRTVVGYRAINYGVQYMHWRHPMSPYYRTKTSNDEWLPVHGQPSGVGWRDWVSLTLEAPTPDGVREPALVVSGFRRRATLHGVTRPTIHAFGFDVDKMKARGWVDATLPAFAIGDAAKRRHLYSTAVGFVDAAGIVASALIGAVSNTLFRDSDSAAGDIGHVRTELWASTEPAFYDAIGRVADLDLNEPRSVLESTFVIKREFRHRLEESAFAVFDRWCPPDGLRPDVLRRRVVARYDLSSMLRGLSKLGEKLFDVLDLPRPGGGREARAQKRTKTRSRPARQKEETE